MLYSSSINEAILQLPLNNLLGFRQIHCHRAYCFYYCHSFSLLFLNYHQFVGVFLHLMLVHQRFANGFIQKLTDLTILFMCHEVIPLGGTFYTWYQLPFYSLNRINFSCSRSMQISKWENSVDFGASESTFTKIAISSIYNDKKMIVK